MIRGSLIRARVLAHLRAKLRAHEITERQAAEAAGCSQPHLANIISGTRTMGESQAEELIAELGISASELFDAEERAAMRRWLDVDNSDNVRNVRMERPGPRLVRRPATTTMDRQARQLHRGRIHAAQLAGGGPQAA